MKGIKEINIDGERIFLKKNNLLGWSVVNPYKIDGKLNWKNILIGGNWFKFGLIVFLIIILLLAINEYSQAVTIAKECLNNPIYNFNIN